MTEIWKEILLQKLDAHTLENMIFVSPDRGGINRVKKLAHEFNAEWCFVEKKRVAHDKSKALKIVGDVEEKNAIIIDDIVDTARTVQEACTMLKDNGAAQIFGCFTHAVLSRGSTERIENSPFTRIWFSDSIEHDKALTNSKMSVVPIHKLFCTYLYGLAKKG